MRGAWIDSLYILVACGVAFQIYLRLNSRRCHTPRQSNNILLKLGMLFPFSHFLYARLSMGEALTWLYFNLPTLCLVTSLPWALKIHMPTFPGQPYNKLKLIYHWKILCGSFPCLGSRRESLRWLRYGLPQNILLQLASWHSKNEDS